MNYPPAFDSRDSFLEEHQPAAFGSYPGETVDDPNQRGLWAPKPGPSYVNSMPVAKSTHLTMKLNIPEAWVLGDSPEVRLAIDVAACQAVRAAVLQMRAALLADLPREVPAAAPVPVAAPAQTSAPPGNRYEECLSCT